MWNGVAIAMIASRHAAAYRVSFGTALSYAEAVAVLLRQVFGDDERDAALIAEIAPTRGSNQQSLIELSVVHLCKVLDLEKAVNKKYQQVFFLKTASEFEYLSKVCVCKSFKSFNGKHEQLILNSI
jgi:hypothetical protein